jgi:hypothetical protein
MLGSPTSFKPKRTSPRMPIFFDDITRKRVDQGYKNESTDIDNYLIRYIFNSTNIELEECLMDPFLLLMFEAKMDYYMEVIKNAERRSRFKSPNPRKSGKKSLLHEIARLFLGHYPNSSVPLGKANG